MKAARAYPKRYYDQERKLKVPKERLHRCDYCGRWFEKTEILEEFCCDNPCKTMWKELFDEGEVNDGGDTV